MSGKREEKNRKRAAGQDGEHVSEEESERMDPRREEESLETVPEEEESTEDSGRRAEPRSKAERERSKKAGRGELAELLSRKNEMLQQMEKKLSEAEQAIARKEDRLLRLAAEFENYRKRTSREWELHKQQANADLMTSLLGVLDDFDRAFEAAEGADDHFREGISLIRASLLEALSRSGLEPIEAHGREFDPQYHEAMGEMESETVEKGHVAEVVQKGYMLKDQVLRPSRVIVSRGS